MNLEQVQQTLAKPAVVIGSVATTEGYRWIYEVGDIMQSLGHIAAGALSILMLLNYIYMKFLKNH
jgi:hypothetical protein